MVKSLVIVESPAKARTLGKHLGKDFHVVASVGHVKDLPRKKIGVEVEENFEPEYVVIPGKKRVLQEIKKQAKLVDEIYLASDPDREGEAIAFHIVNELRKGEGKKKKFFRMLIHEITKRGVTSAIEKSVEFDETRKHIFDAQQARRILDRLVGYQISPILWKKVQAGLSAGRVQSVAVRFVVEREREVRAFVPEEYWTLSVQLEGSKEPVFAVKLVKKDGKKLRVTSEADMDAITTQLQDGSFKLNDVIRKQRLRNPIPPFITSKLQQEAARKLRFTAKQTMAVAQRLYEGVELPDEGPVGLITYMRTDSVRIADEALEEVREYISTNHGAEYLPEKPNFYKNRKNIQDAHEAIRPTSAMRTPANMRKHLSEEEFKLYDLIWKRFVASQMAQARFDQTVFDVVNGPYSFTAQADILMFPGFLSLYEEGKDSGGENGKDTDTLPILEAGEDLATRSMDKKQNFTQPPPRFTEASLVKEMEERGIGRPSTYAAILSTIQDKSYVNKAKGKFMPTELGELITDLLLVSFPEIMDADFTADLENRLDDVEEGTVEWRNLLAKFYEPFAKQLEEAKDGMRNVKREAIPTDVDCPACSKKMVIRWGKRGSFLACSGYPECRTTMEYERDETGTVIPREMKQEDVGDCPKCGAKLLVRNGRFGRFISCSTYPDCDYRASYSTGAKCPKEDCDGNLVEKRTRKGRTFYGCSKYPSCDFATWHEPVAQKCPSCGVDSMVKLSRNGRQILQCEICKYTQEVMENETEILDD